MKTKHLITLACIISAVLNINAQSGAKYATGGNSTSAGDIFGTTNAQPINFVTSNTLKMVLDVTGNLRLVNFAGTGNRLVLTDINGNLITLPQGTANQVLYGNGTWGNLPAAPTQLWSVSGNNIFYNGGNVGIGNNAPQYKLDVFGDARISNNLYVGGGIIITEAITADTIHMGSSRMITGNTNIDGDVSTTGDVAVSQSLSVIGDVATNSKLTVGGNATFNGTLKNVALAGTGERILVADAAGNLKPIGGTGNGGACVYATPWYLGGNSLLNASLAHNTIGTCNDVPFILKSNDVKSVFIQPNGFVGIGVNNSSPNAPFDVSDGITSPGYHFKIFGNSNGDVETNTSLRISYGNVPTDVFELNYGGGTNRMFINAAGNIAFGDNNLASANNAKLNVNVTSNSVNAFEVYNSGNPLGTNTTFKVRGDGKTIIGPPLLNTSAHFNSSMLTVNGKLVSKEIIVTQQSWSDFVFDNKYNLMPLAELEVFYKTNHHLPNVPTTKQIIADGNDLGKTDAILLQKIEELTLYIVELQKQINKLKKINDK